MQITSGQGIWSALLARVILYDVLEEGFHSPLTREQIAELFHVGRLNRNSPCKLAVKTEWRTVDELFPLLKHDSPYRNYPALEERKQISVWILLGICTAGLLGLGLIYLGPVRSAVAPARRQPIGLLITSAQPMYSVTAYRAQPVYSISPSFAAPATNINTSSIGATSAATHFDENQEAERSRLEQQRLAREQLQRNEATKAERLRAENAQRETERQRAAGKDFIVPLDKDFWIGESGLAVLVRVRDNDVTSFDVCINGRWRREVKKEKGITGSRTDETLIRSQGSASLYYVWEISGEPNHCRLRLREG